MTLILHKQQHANLTKSDKPPFNSPIDLALYPVRPQMMPGTDATHHMK